MALSGCNANHPCVGGAAGDARFCATGEAVCELAPGRPGPRSDREPNSLPGPQGFKKRPRQLRDTAQETAARRGDEKVQLFTVSARHSAVVRNGHFTQSASAKRCPISQLSHVILKTDNFYMNGKPAAQMR